MSPPKYVTVYWIESCKYSVMESKDLDNKVMIFDERVIDLVKYPDGKKYKACVINRGDNKIKLKQSSQEDANKALKKFNEDSSSDSTENSGEDDISDAEETNVDGKKSIEENSSRGRKTVNESSEESDDGSGDEKAENDTSASSQSTEAVPMSEAGKSPPLPKKQKSKLTMPTDFEEKEDPKSLKSTQEMSTPPDNNKKMSPNGSKNSDESPSKSGNSPARSPGIVVNSPADLVMTSPAPLSSQAKTAEIENKSTPKTNKSSNNSAMSIDSPTEYLKPPSTSGNSPTKSEGNGNKSAALSPRKSSRCNKKLPIMNSSTSTIDGINPISTTQPKPTFSFVKGDHPVAHSSSTDGDNPVAHSSSTDPYALSEDQVTFIKNCRTETSWESEKKELKNKCEKYKMKYQSAKLEIERLTKLNEEWQRKFLEQVSRQTSSSSQQETASSSSQTNQTDSKKKIEELAELYGLTPIVQGGLKKIEKSVESVQRLQDPPNKTTGILMEAIWSKSELLNGCLEKTADSEAKGRTPLDLKKQKALIRFIAKYYCVEKQKVTKRMTNKLRDTRIANKDPNAPASKGRGRKRKSAALESSTEESDD